MMAEKTVSLESMLDEERRDVLALLEGPPVAGRTRASIGGSGQASSPFTRRRSPVRSMLDVDDDISPSATRHASIAGTNGGVAPTSQPAPIRSMLDPYTPPATPVVRSMLDIKATISKRSSSGTPLTKSATSSPIEATHREHIRTAAHPRSHSDASAHPASFGPRADRRSVESAYQFSGYLPSNPGGPSVLKRNTQAGKSRSSLPSAMAEVVRAGGDLPSLGSLLGGTRDIVRSHSVASTGNINGAKSKSPGNWLSLRSASPSGQLSAVGSTFKLKNGKVIDMKNAHRRLSDANLALSEGGLSSLGVNGRARANSDDAKLRLQKDYIDGEDAVESTDDESDPDNPRGRQGRVNSKDEPEATLDTTKGATGGPKVAQSVLAAVEDERKEVAALNEKYKVRSLLDPEITITEASGDRFSKVSNPGVHPITSFDESGFNTPVDSDAEADLTDIKRAQKLPITQTSIISTPSTSRCVRTLFRGDFAKIQKEASENQRRVRKYLVATDLSDEAAHALEWTIGTVLRDGDTLLAIYCVDEELGINEGDQSRDQPTSNPSSTPKSGSFTISTPLLGPVQISSPLARPVPHSPSGTPSPYGSRNKAEQERYRAVNDITERVSKLLRKTKLQVKVVIEVIHCKSPKHLITEVIDFVGPTLVILGSRGRSALKGVILGSFSNYLVTKSSVPVMVARKRLRKHNKYKRPAIKLTNNLTNPTIKSLAAAKID